MVFIEEKTFHTTSFGLKSLQHVVNAWKLFLGERLDARK